MKDSNTKFNCIEDNIVSVWDDTSIMEVFDIQLSIENWLSKGAVYPVMRFIEQ